MKLSIFHFPNGQEKRKAALAVTEFEVLRQWQASNSARRLPDQNISEELNVYELGELSLSRSVNKNKGSPGSTTGNALIIASTPSVGAK
jgi:hypothetical protein